MASRASSGDSERASEILRVFKDAFSDLMAKDPTAFEGKFRKMAATPFSFYRGAACLFYHDMCNKYQQNAYINHKTGHIWIHGDLHAENFGTYMDSRGRLLFNVNDFDEAYVGPFIWDLKRLSASIALIGYGKALSDDQISRLIKDLAESYRKKIHSLASGSQDIVGFTVDTARGPLLGALRDARLQSRVAMLDSTTTIDGYDRRFSDGGGVVKLDDETKAKVHEAFVRYLETLPAPKKKRDCRVKDIVGRRGVGIGSAGLPTYNLLVAGENEALESDIVIYMKESQPSAVSSQLQVDEAKSYFKHEGHRTVISQRALQAHADPWLGWTEVNGKGYMVSEVSPFGVDIEWSGINDPDEMAAVVADLGEAVAVMHAVADEDSEHSLVPFSTEKAISNVLEDDAGEFERYLTSFAHQYSHQTRKDHQLFIDAFRNGQIPGLNT